MSLPQRLRPAFQAKCVPFLSPARPIKSSSPFVVIYARFQSNTAAAPPPPSSPALSATAAAAAPLLSTFLVTPQALSNALRKNIHTKISTAPRIIPLCAAWFMPNDPDKRTGRGAYLAGHIASARFFDIDAISDKDSPYPHMLPSPDIFSKAMSQLGIRRDDTVVVYDSAELGIFSAPRTAWTLKAFGHDQVHILNNFKLWVDQGFPIEKGESEVPIEATNYPTPELDSTYVVKFEELKERIQEQGKEGAEKFTIIDARSHGRFEGTAEEPRPGKTNL
jgi:thiosulfate/3-mercaptopyruvate sulfurtransferase